MDAKYGRHKENRIYKTECAVKSGTGEDNKLRDRIVFEDEFGNTGMRNNSNKLLDVSQIKQEVHQYGSQENGPNICRGVIGLELKKESTDQEKNKDNEKLYADHEIKEEMVLGPVVLLQTTTLQTNEAVLPVSPKVEIPDEKGDEEEILAMLKEEDMIIEKDLNLKSCILTNSESTADKSFPKFKILKCIEEREISEETPDVGNEASGADVGVLSSPTLPCGVSFEPDRTFICKICGKQFNEETQLIQHHVSLDTTSNGLKRHMRVHTGEKPFACSMCTYKCAHKSALKQHTLVHTGEKPFACSMCTYKCAHKSALKQHTLVHTGEKPFACSMCTYKCSQKSTLEIHMRVHTGEKPFACSVCTYKCSLKGSLEKHMRVHTGEKPFACSMCTYKCTHKSALKQHTLVHTGEKPFACSMCTYKGSRKGALKDHITRVHTGEKPFACSVCTFKSFEQGALKQHMQIHSGEKPFSCFVCTYKCSQKRYLKQHMRVHTGEKPFSCSLCTFKCHVKFTLKQHMLVHTGEKPFSCSVCTYKCTKISYLKQHMLVHTGNTDSE